MPWCLLNIHSLHFNQIQILNCHFTLQYFYSISIFCLLKYSSVTIFWEIYNYLTIFIHHNDPENNYFIYCITFSHTNFIKLCLFCLVKSFLYCNIFHHKNMICLRKIIRRLLHGNYNQHIVFTYYCMQMFSYDSFESHFMVIVVIKCIDFLLEIQRWSFDWNCTIIHIRVEIKFLPLFDKLIFITMLIMLVEYDFNFRLFIFYQNNYFYMYHYWKSIFKIISSLSIMVNCNKFPCWILFIPLISDVYLDVYSNTLFQNQAFIY